MTRPSDAVVGKLTEETATDWAPAVLYTLINGRRSQYTVEPSLTTALHEAHGGDKKKSCKRGQTRTKRPSERMRLLNPHVEETGEVVRYILFSR